MEGNADYKRVMTEVISKQSVILGPEIAIMRAKSVQGLVLTPSGEVVDVSGNPKEVLKQLIERYAELSGQVVRATLMPIFKKYPSVEVFGEV